MIQIEYRSQHQGQLNALIEGVGRTDVRFRTEVRQLLIEGNRHDRLAGRDRTGRSMRAVRLPRRGRRYSGATGPPLAPHGELSRSVRSFFASWQGDLLVAGYRGPGVEILGYHAAGRSGTGRKGEVTGVVRDVLGVSPITVATIRAEFQFSLRAMFNRTVRTARAVGSRAADFAGSVVSLGGSLR